jgi:hypothetical protein
MPFRINTTIEAGLKAPEWKRNSDLAIARGIHDCTGQARYHNKPLAIVGSGPSMLNLLDEIRQFPGDVFGINATADFLIRNGREDTIFFSMDPDPCIADMIGVAKRGVVCSSCDPSVFDKLKPVRMFHTEQSRQKKFIGGSCTSVTRIPILSGKMGYRHVFFYGCEGSFAVDTTHVGRNEDREDQIIIQAGENIYRTSPDMMVQCEYLAECFRKVPNRFHNRSGGLLQAMLDYPDTWEVVAVSKSVFAKLEAANGVEYEQEPYEVNVEMMT